MYVDLIADEIRHDNIPELYKCALLLHSLVHGSDAKFYKPFSEIQSYGR